MGNMKIKLESVIREKLTLGVLDSLNLTHWLFCFLLFLCVCALGQSVQFSRSVMSNSLQPHESQHARPACCPSPPPRVHSNSCPSSQWCHPAISFSVIPFSSCPQTLPASESFPMSRGEQISKQIVLTGSSFLTVWGRSYKWASGRSWGRLIRINFVMLD